MTAEHQADRELVDKLWDLLVLAYNAGTQESPSGRVQLERVRALMRPTIDIADPCDEQVRLRMDNAEALLKAAGV